MSIHRKILVVEDDQKQAAGLMRIFRQEGDGTVNCEHASTFAEGVRMSLEDDFDCVVLDAGLPDEDLSDSYAVVSRISEFRCPVVVYTGSGDPGLFAAVRKMNAAIVTKPGIELLIEKVWGAINRVRPDRESEMLQLQAQRTIIEGASVKEKDFIEKQGPRIALIILLLTTSCGFGAWAWNTISSQARHSEQIEQEIKLINKRLDSAEVRGIDKEAHLKLHDQQNQVSIDDRSAIHLQLASMYDTQHELKLDVVRRLERIEDSVLTLIKKESKP